MTDITKPCPNCGGTATCFEQYARDYGAGSRHHVACTACGARGPAAGSDHDALVAWNRRAGEERVNVEKKKGRHWVSMREGRAAILLYAARELGYDLWVGPQEYAAGKRIDIPGHVGIWTNELPTEKSDLWKRYNELAAQVRKP